MRINDRTHSYARLVAAFVSMLVATATTAPAAAADAPSEPAPTEASQEPASPPPEPTAPEPRSVVASDQAQATRKHDADGSEPRFRITCDYPVVDAPFNTAGWNYREIEWPSMAQSLSLSKCVYQLAHKGIHAAISSLVDAPIWQKLGIAAFDLLMPGRPLGAAWVHEEWHRSIMTVRRIASRNEIYDLRFGLSMVRVSQVTDANLAELKRSHNPDLVRLAAAGVESSYEYNLALEKDEFFRRTTVYNRVLLWLNHVQGAFYVASSMLNTPDQFERESHEGDRTELQKDFVGHDITSWAYDLFRPGEPYANRGLHPLGAGVDRSIGGADLSSKEREYLAVQSGLSLLNFVDPFLFGETYFRMRVGEREILWNATLRHHLTSFGNSIDANLFLKSTPIGDAFFVVHGYTNAVRPFFGLEAQLVDLPLGSALLLSPRAILWQQPRDQAFRTSSGRFGGLVAARIAVPIAPWLRPYVELEGKSAGWAAGNPYLDAVVSARLGIASTF